MRALRVLGSVALTIMAITAHAQTTTKFPVSEYGYIPINSTYDSAMFYSLQSNRDATEAQRSQLPLVMWLQGGPGASSLFGDFLENGPVEVKRTGNSASDYELVNRTNDWTQYASMLYVDNPVGTGFSYSANPEGLSTTDQGIADNLVTFMNGFLVKHPEFAGKEFWVFCESYGGKMTAVFGATLMKKVQAGAINLNFKGVALGDGWVDPVGCMASYGPYLQGFSQLTRDQVANVTSYATMAATALQNGKGEDATNLWGEQQQLITQLTNDANWYNVLYYYDYTAENQFDEYVSTTLAWELGSLIPPGVVFGGQGGEVFNAMGGAFMMPAIQQVQEMIDGGLNVNVYGGQVDLIVDTLCIQGWLNKLPWSELDAFFASPRQAFAPPAGSSTAYNVSGFVQSLNNFAYWQINQAGHMVPLDQPWAAEYMFTTIIGATMGDRAPQQPEKRPDGRQTIHRLRKSPAKFMKQ